jgi:hypothetical protein
MLFRDIGHGGAWSAPRNALDELVASVWSLVAP